MTRGIYSNNYQGPYTRALCVCTMGMLRSPTLAYVLNQEPYNYNTRACGAHELALIPVTEALVDWADVIFVFSSNIEISIKDKTRSKKVINLNIPDDYDYMDEELLLIIDNKLMELDL